MPGPAYGSRIGESGAGCALQKSAQGSRKGLPVSSSKAGILDRREALGRTLEVLQSAHECWSGGRILVACHEGIIKCILYHLAHRAFLSTEKKLLLPSYLHRIVFDGREFVTEAVNAVHLNA